MYSLKVITREIRFCRSKIGFKNVLSEAPQTSNPYVMCGSIKALYNVINIFLETKFLILYNIPTFLLSILHTLSMCVFHVKFLSIHIPRKDELLDLFGSSCGYTCSSRGCLWILSVRDEFRSGGWSLLPEYFFHCLHENQVVLPEYYLIFCPKTAISKILGGLQPPSAPWAVRLCLYMIP